MCADVHSRRADSPVERPSAPDPELAELLVDDLLFPPNEAAPPGNAPTGDVAALNALLPTVYDELRRLAAAYLRAERPDHTLQPTALVHEAYLRLLEQRQVDWQNRGQFLGVAARVMRRILARHARARAADKRNPETAPQLALDGAFDFYVRREISLAAVDEALGELEALDARQARIVELRFFGGMTIEEAAELLAISPATVKREWSTAKRWLHRAIAARN